MNQFTSTPVLNIPSNTFDLSYDVQLTCDAGFVVPVDCQETLPGQSYRYSNNTFVRLAPMIAPIMHKLDVTTVTGFVPWRLIWENSQKFFVSPVPDENTPVPPHFSNQVIAVGDLGDYLGLPTQKVYDETTGGTFDQYDNFGIDWFSAGPFAAYQKFFNDWFRDENLYNNGEEVPFMLGDGVNDYYQFKDMRRRAWRHDYFTSSLPFAQKGDPVEIPIANFSNVPVSVVAPDPNRRGAFQTASGSNISGNFDVTVNGTGGPVAQTVVNGAAAVYDPNGTLMAQTSQLSNAAAVTVNTLRWAEKLQVFLEKNARGGTRYTEIVRQHFGVRSSDARLQRAEFLGFSVNPVVISEVLQTSPSTVDNTPLAEMAGHGISYGGSKTVNYFAEEHGFFMTFMIIRPRSSYMQGLSRMWWRKDPLQYAWPTFAQLGEQEIKNKEIYYFSQSDPYNEGTFGYLPRYAEYRYLSDRCCGEMRTSYAHWHMNRIFRATSVPELPALNEDFISCSPTKRVFAVNTAGSHPYIINIKHNIKSRIPLPKFGIPAL